MRFIVELWLLKFLFCAYLACCLMHLAYAVAVVVAAVALVNYWLVEPVARQQQQLDVVIRLAVAPDATL